MVGKSCWDYFHPDEIPFARAIHGRGIRMDKAAALNYCQIKNRDGRWVGCECVFTIVHDVLVGCTSIYRRGIRSQSESFDLPRAHRTAPDCSIERAEEAPIIRRLFSSSPRDPRYHMLSYISQKFSKESQTLTHEPRAALFLNRFSRTLTIMYATTGLADILGISAQELNGRSFYYCIQENCLREAVKCLESAKANDSIAYLRFWFRDPRQDDQLDQDEHMSDGHSSGDEDDGGVHVSELMDRDGSENVVASEFSHSLGSSVERNETIRQNTFSLDPNSRSSSGNSTDIDGSSNDAIFDQPVGGQSRTSSVSTTDEPQSTETTWIPNSSQIEVEAVVSCTSDGLVVILRRAKPVIPHIARTAESETAQHPYANGFFASPWATDPILPDVADQAQRAFPNLAQPSLAASVHPTAAREDTAATKGPANEDFMNSIREVAVFAWSLTGINGSLAQYGRGTPTGESQPPGGLPIWDPTSDAGAERQHSYSTAYENTPGSQLQSYIDSNSGHTQSNGSSPIRYDMSMQTDSAQESMQYSCYNDARQPRGSHRTD